jgi:eukaryotic-like serine/threonine-protein kinase
MGKFKDFFKPDRLGFHLLLAVGITIFLIVIAMIFLKIYTRHGQEVEMPDFIGKDSKTLIQNTSSADFIMVVSDYVYDKSQPEGIVLKQNPQAKEMVKKGRKVYLTIASSIPPKVKMPELKDVSQRQAEIMLKAIGLEVGDVIFKASPFENAVLEQLYKGRAIAAGTEISMGESVTLVVGKDINDLPEANDSLVNVAE